jgi:MFS family permease
MTAKSSRYPAFTYHDFRLLWIGQLLSNMGTQMQFTALNWHIYLLTHSAFALGLIGLARFIPILVFSLFGGVTADAFNRKKTLLTTQIILTILASILAITTLSGHITPPLIYLITVLSTIVFAFDGPTRQAFFPSLVDREHLPNAVSLNSVMFQTSTIVGPGVAGFIIASMGIGSVYAINALSYLAVITALLMMFATGEIAGKKTKIAFSSIVEGFVFVKSQTLIWSTMLLDFFSTFFASATALLPVFAKDILHVGPEGFGILSAAPAIGAVIAGFIIAHMKGMKKQGYILLTAVTCYALGTILFGISHIFILSFIGLFIVGAGDSVSTIIRNTIRQLATPDYIRGRMTGINMIFFMGGPQLGEFEAGVLASAVGGPLSVVLGGIGTLVAIAAMTILVPTLRKFDFHEEFK